MSHPPRRMRDACLRRVDGRSARTVLREEEWRTASEMARPAPLGREVDELRAEAASDRVHAALRPKAEVVDAARRAVLRWGNRVDRYMRPVGAAITAYREWEQLARLVWGTDAYADLLAHAHAGPAGDLPHDPTGDFALMEARGAIEARVREAHEAADWLTAAARSDL